jgi:DegV family protein with EDD domain
MSKVGMVIDSGISIPQELITEYGIEVVPLVTVFGDKLYRDRIDLKSPSELFRLIDKSDSFPTTSAPSPIDYLEKYKELSRRADSILHLSMSSKLSVSFNSASMAKEMAAGDLPGVKIEVLDAMTTVGAAGFIALAAARAGAAGKSLAQVVKTAKEVRAKVTMIFIMDTLTYLARSGRIGKAQALMGNMLSIKPIVEIPTTSGRVEPVTRVRTKPKAVKQLLDIVAQRVGTKPIRIMVEHTAVPEEAAKLKEMVSARFNCTELLLCEFNPTGAVTIGPGNLGLSFYSD